MWILSIDTALRSGNIAVAQNGAVVYDTVLGDGMKHSSRVLEAVDGLMQKAGITLAELDGLAVTVGPGSFTGLRIGMSTVKGLAFALNKPVAGLCVLETLAQQAEINPDATVTSMVDGSKQEVFTRSYRLAHGVFAPVGGYANPGYQAAAEAITHKTVLIGNGVPLVESLLTTAQREFVQIAPPETWLLQNATLAKMAWEQFKAGDVLDGGAVTPNYIRKSDAEINLCKNFDAA